MSPHATCGRQLKSRPTLGAPAVHFALFKSFFISNMSSLLPYTIALLWLLLVLAAPTFATIIVIYFAVWEYKFRDQRVFEQEKQLDISSHSPESLEKHQSKKHSPSSNFSDDDHSFRNVTRRVDRRKISTLSAVVTEDDGLQCHHDSGTKGLARFDHMEREKTSQSNITNPINGDTENDPIVASVNPQAGAGVSKIHPALQANLNGSHLVDCPDGSFSPVVRPSDPPSPLENKSPNLTETESESGKGDSYDIGESDPMETSIHRSLTYVSLPRNSIARGGMRNHFKSSSTSQLIGRASKISQGSPQIETSSFGRLSVNSFSTPLNPTIENFNFPSMYSAVRCDVPFAFVDRPLVNSAPAKSTNCKENLLTDLPAYTKDSIKFSHLCKVYQELAERVLSHRRRQLKEKMLSNIKNKDQNQNANQSNKCAAIYICSLTFSSQCRRIMTGRNQASIHSRRMHSGIDKPVRVTEIPEVEIF